MQVQNNINDYELYSDRASGARKTKRYKAKQMKRKAMLSVVLLLSAVALVSAVFAVNVAFDSSVFAATPDFSLKSPEYSSYNAVFTEFKPTVTFSVFNRGGDELILSTEAVELQEILEKQDIALDDTCVVNYPLNTTVYDGMEVVIDSITYEEVTLTETIPFEVNTIELQTIPKGTRNVLTKGQDGTLSKVIKKKYVNGVYQSEELLSETTTLEPVTEVAQLGVGGSLVGKDGITYNYSYYIDVQATCYGKADGSGSITASGTLAREGVIAVDPRVIPLGTVCYVKGDYRDIGICYAEDTGGAIKGNIIDVYLEGTLEQLLQFGRRNMRVYIIE